jgi:hypothetical protein
MPYFVFRINEAPVDILKNLELLNEFESYQQAQEFAKQTRVEDGVDDPASIKVMFADTRLQAEEQLMQKRPKPIVREWEK